MRSPYFSGVGRGPLTIGAYGHADFMTCFGSFSLKKWRRYTGRPDLTPILRFETSEPVDVTLTEMVYHRVEKHAIGAVDHAPQRTEDGWYRYDITYPDGLDAQIVAFTVTCGPHPTIIRDVAYGADLPEGRDIRIEIITTTFRKERQVQGNIETLRRSLLSDPQWGRHFRLTVVDNGRTLPDDVHDPEHGVTLIRNGNVGGAGGFAAGMLHAWDEGWATHVLMMDDDVTVCPESFKRTVRLLSQASGDYADGIVAGAMMSNANYELQQEDIGVIQPERHLLALKPRLLMDREYDITLNEELMPQTGRQGLYSAWWYSCVPMDRVRAAGLPIPLFYRRDDVEYGTRLQEGGPVRFMTMNGICVWHDTFDLRWNQAVEAYLSNRNLLIQEAFTPDPMNSMDANIDCLRRQFENARRRFEYTAMEMICDAVDDYLRGPEYYMHPVGERLFMQAVAKNERPVPLAELAGAPDVVDMRVVEDDANDVAVPAGPGDAAGLPRRIVRRLGRAIGRPVHGPAREEPLDESLGIIPIDGGCTPWKVMHRRRRVLAVTPDGTRGVIRERDDARAGELTARFEALAARLHAEDVASRYRRMRPDMTSRGFWRAYLAESLEEAQAAGR